MTVWQALGVLMPFGVACYAIGGVHAVGFLTMSNGSSRDRTHPHVRHFAKAPGRASESRNGDGFDGGTGDPSEHAYGD